MTMSFAFCYSLCFLVLLLLPIAAQSNTNITLGSSLTAGDGLSWASPSGDYAFGFQQVGTGGFLLAIWFDKILDKTVIWSANGGSLAPRGSKLKLTSDGRLVLNDPSGSEIWSRTDSAGAAQAAMLNTGNFVLTDKSSAVVWQSFGEPTDTILPTQIMSQGTVLTARLSEANYSLGRFQLNMQSDGNLVLYTVNWPQDTTNYFAYTATATVGSGYQVVFDKSGSIQVTAKNGTVVAPFLSASVNPTQDLYQRAILEFDGVFRLYVYPRSTPTNTPKNWTISDYTPTNICNRMDAGMGGGACGFNSYCQIGDDQRPTCSCPPHYSFVDQMDHMKGCKPDFNLQSCSEEIQANNQFELKVMNDIDFPQANYETFHPITENDCREICLSDCYCAAAVFREQQCWKKRFPLSNGGAYDSTTTYIKVGIGNSTTNPEPDQHNPIIRPSGGSQKERKQQTVILIESFFFGSSVLLNILILTLAVTAGAFCTNKRKGKILEHRDIAGTNLRHFSYSELEEATNGFKEVVGVGAFATVYKGLLASEEGNVIAVKKLNEMAKDNQKEFESEVRAIARTGHRNLVRLIGFCNEQQHRLLVYEYMPNGSLSDNLFQGHRPNWFERIKFAFETAKGLNYLHEECSLQIIHCDIKPQNVLLDGSFTARISDFGLAKLLKKDQAYTMTGIRGTKGYVAPEWFKSIPITTKVDVYSYGILLLELVCCRRCFDAEMEDERQIALADWAYDCYKEGRIDKLVENDYEALTDIENVKKFVMIALWCIQEDPSRRPSMNEVAHIIKGALMESTPIDLASCISSMDESFSYSLASSTEHFGDAD